MNTTAAEEMNRLGIPGAAVALIRDGQPAFARGFGVSRLGTDDAVTPETIFQIGSVTKTFTAVAALKLASLGVLDLSAPLSRYLDGMSPEIGRLTLEQLLSHTAGLKDEAPYYGSSDESALRDTPKRWGSDYLFTSPGEIFSYSNPGYALAGAVIEAAAGMPLADVMSGLIFQPLGMAHTSLRPVPGAPGVAAGHIARDGETVPLRANANNVVYWPAGYITSTVLDVSRFLQCLLGGGRLDGQQVLPPDIVDRLTSRQVPIPGASSAYGFGISVSARQGVRMLAHDGAIAGFASRISLVPEKRFALVVLSNKHGAVMSRTAEAALRGVVQRPDITASALEGAPPLTNDVAGLYSQCDTSLEVLRDGGDLMLRYEGGAVPLTAAGEDRFTYSLPESTRPSELLFVRVGGEIKYLHTKNRAYARQQR